jgi:transcriptional regulator with XRE-family HTH domain
MNRERFGKYLHARRVEKGLSRKELADAVGMSDRSIKSIELGDTRPASERLFEWAKVLEVDPKVLFEELEEPFPLEETPQRFIPLPDDFPLEAQKQVERFAKFLQYEKEFDQFLALNGYFASEEELQESLDNFVREVQEAFSTSEDSKEERKSRIS